MVLFHRFSKKGKDLLECSSHQSIAVSSVFAKVFELLTINNLRSLCYMLPHQFGYQPKLGCFHALKCLCKFLIDVDKSGGTLALGTYDVSKSFDSLLHPQAMNELLNRGVLLDLVRPLLYSYHLMKAKIRIPGSNFLTDVVPIHIRVKQGVVTSPTVYNNATLPDQCQTFFVLYI